MLEKRHYSDRRHWSKCCAGFHTSQGPKPDIAIIPARDIALPSGRTAKDYDIAILAVSVFATKDHFAKKHVQVGDEVFLTGWFSSFFGTAQNYPIARFGRLAMVTNEKIPWRDAPNAPAQLVDLYLIEAHATKGNSGSPVFFRPGLQREPGTFTLGRPTLLLAGVLKGYFGGREQTNFGIAAVVPAFQLHEIMVSEEVKRHHESAPKIRTPPDSKRVKTCLEGDSSKESFGPALIYPWPYTECSC